MAVLAVQKKKNSDYPTKVPFGADGFAIGTTKEYRSRCVCLPSMKLYTG